MSQISTISFFNVKGISNKFWALKQMGLASRSTDGTSGLILSKMMGTGNGNGFSSRPDFSNYALIAVWESREQADSFFSDHSFISEYRERANSIKTFFLRANKVHGLWGGKQPFDLNGKIDTENPIVVLTRARIRNNKLIQFWRSVPSVSKSMEGATGLLFSKGIGELPLIFQATVSEWSSREKMVDFAYRNPKHAEVIKKTRQLDWYSEEMFVEFELVEKVSN